MWRTYYLIFDPVAATRLYKVRGMANDRCEVEKELTGK
jgi:hypothetical protein